MDKSELKERINKAKVKNHLKNWAMKVRINNMAYQIPEELIDSLDPKLDKYVKPALEELKLVQMKGGFWERR